MKTYTFFDDSYFASNGCDCCDDTYMECYNSNDTDCNLGSANNREDCYIQAIMTETGVDSCGAEYRGEHLELMSLEQLKQVSKMLKIKVEIVS